MEFRQLQYFLTLCNELHFSQAAEKLGISQPTLSQQIRVLEGEIGVPLFDRIGKKTIKTEAGSILEKHALEIAQSIENAKNELSDLTDEHTGRIRVAVLPSDLDYRLAPLLASFHKAFPKTIVQVVPSINILNQVLDNEVDIGVGLAIQPDRRIHRKPFYKESYSLYVHEAHPLAQKEKVYPDDLRDVPLVIYPEGFYGRELVENWYREHGLTVEAIMETGSVTSLMQLVGEGVGAAIHPGQLIESFQSLGVRAIPMEGCPVRNLEIYYRSDKYMSIAARTFMEKLEAFFV